MIEKPSLTSDIIIIAVVESEEGAKEQEPRLPAPSKEEEFELKQSIARYNNTPKINVNKKYLINHINAQQKKMYELSNMLNLFNTAILVLV